LRHFKDDKTRYFSDTTTLFLLAPSSFGAGHFSLENIFSSS